MEKINKITAKSSPEALLILWEEGYFIVWRNFGEIEGHLSKRGNNFPKHSLRMALVRAQFLTPHKNKGILEYIQKTSSISKKSETMELLLFDDVLIKKFGKSFEQEFIDLHLNFDKSGTCTAFLLRKILEKLIYLVFAKNKIETKLEDKNNPGRLVGLDAMINIATKEKIKGIPFLLPKTAREISGIKFLGDTSAHNFLINVDMHTILPQMPFIITAYKELAERM